MVSVLERLHSCGTCACACWRRGRARAPRRSGSSVTSWNRRLRHRHRRPAHRRELRRRASAPRPSAPRRGTTRFTMPSSSARRASIGSPSRDQLERRLAPDLAHQVRHHDRGDDAVLHLGIAELRADSAMSGEVAGEREARAAAHRRAVDRGDHRLGHPRERLGAAHRQLGARRSTSGWLSAVRSLNSERSAPAQKPGPAPVSTTQRTASSASAARSASSSVSRQRGVERVALLRPVHREDADRAAVLGQQFTASSSLRHAVSANGRSAARRASARSNSATSRRTTSRRGHELVDQSGALPDLDLAPLDVAVERGLLEGSCS